MEDENQEKRPTPYFDSYKQRYDKFMNKKKEDRQEKLKPEGFIGKVEDEIKVVENVILTEEQKIVEEVKGKIGEGWQYFTEPRHIRVLKIIAVLIPILIILFLLYSNFLVSKDFTYFYDIGGPQDAIKPYLSPANRVSDIVDDSSFRTLNSGLVYFDVSIPRGSETIQTHVRFKDNFPENGKLSLGAKDQEVWHYLSNPIYDKGLELGDLYRQGNVYLLNENLVLTSADGLKNQNNIVIVTDTPFTPVENKISDYSGETTISTSLRGGHTFYIYTSGNLALEVKKQDINWYNGTDELEISLYDSQNQLIANSTIPDDGITEAKHGQAIIQSGSLGAENLQEGVYKLEFKDFDGLIREIKVNTKKIVASSKVFLADSSVYGLDNKESVIYLNSTRNSQLKLQTWHKEGFQTITYNNKQATLSNTTIPKYVNLTSGDFTLNSKKNDIIISYPGYFAFSKSSYFEPFKQRVIGIQNNLQWLKENADYLITDYEAPTEDGNWLEATTNFNIPLDNLYVKDNKLSMMFSIPHLSDESLQNFTIPIDWIKIKVHKPGLFEKWGNKE